MSKVMVMNQDGMEVLVKHSTFPAGEVYIKILEPELVTQSMTVILLSADSEQIMRAIMLADALYEVGAKELTLDAPYLPYSRQDRVCNPGESFSLNTILNMLNLAGYATIKTLDVHNPESVCGWVVNTHVDYALHLEQVLIEGTVIVSPDKGAVGRCQLASCGEYPVATLEKQRTSGGIVQKPATMVDWQLIREAKSLLIVDDICDGGATFLSAAKVLRELNPTASLHLFVTHGIFSQGMEKLEEVFDTVRCANRYHR